MKSWSTNCGSKAETGRKKQNTALFHNFGKLILDATKLSFGGLVLGTIIKGDLPQSTLLVAGIIASGIGAIIGLILTTIYEEK